MFSLAPRDAPINGLTQQFFWTPLQFSSMPLQLSLMPEQFLITELFSSMPFLACLLSLQCRMLCRCFGYSRSSRSDQRFDKTILFDTRTILLGAILILLDATFFNAKRIPKSMPLQLSMPILPNATSILLDALQCHYFFSCLLTFATVNKISTRCLAPRDVPINGLTQQFFWTHFNSL